MYIDYATEGFSPLRDIPLPPLIRGICTVETQNFAFLHIVGAIHELPLRVFRCNVHRLCNRGLPPSAGHPPAPFDKGEFAL